MAPNSKSLTDYMKKELIFYIRQEYEKGHSLSAIKDALSKGGHHKDLVRQALDSLKKHNFNVIKALDEPIQNNLDEELYLDIVSSLVKYIKHQLNEGYSTKKIKEILIKYGHSHDLIDEALKKATLSDMKKNRSMKTIYEIGFISIFALILIYIMGATQERFEIVLFSFIPTILTIIASKFIHKEKDMHYLLAVPAFLSIIFMIGTIYAPITEGFESVKIGFFNLILSYIYVGISYSEESKKEKSKQ